MPNNFSSQVRDLYNHMRTVDDKFPKIADSRWSDTDEDWDMFLDAVDKHKVIVAARMYAKGDKKRAISMYIASQYKVLEPVVAAEAEKVAEGALRLAAKIYGV